MAPGHRLARSGNLSPESQGISSEHIRGRRITPSPGKLAVAPGLVDCQGDLGVLVRGPEYLVMSKEDYYALMFAVGLNPESDLEIPEPLVDSQW